jgi:hypothetical protein
MTSYSDRLAHLRATNQLEAEIACWRMVVQLLCTRHLKYPWRENMSPEDVARMMDEQIQDKQ